MAGHRGSGGALGFPGGLLRGLLDEVMVGGVLATAATAGIWQGRRQVLGVNLFAPIGNGCERITSMTSKVCGNLGQFLSVTTMCPWSPCHPCAQRGERRR
jgi:hypothetical protein